MVIPRVMLTDVSLRDAIDFLRVETASLDFSNADQNQRGINFTINLGPDDSPIVQDVVSKRFDLKLQDVPVAQVLARRTAK